VGSNTVVPNDYGSWSPLHSSLEILSLGQVVVEEFEEEITLLLLVTDDAAAELWVDKKSLLASGGVGSNERVDGSNWVSADDASSVLAVVRLLDGFANVSVCFT
jgi:hypothetical protein